MIGLHSDDTNDLEGPIISLSLGAERQFDIKGKGERAGERHQLTLAHGSLLVMSIESQKVYRHGIRKQPQVTGGRINVTCRSIREHAVTDR